ncbi:hypothetical protein VOLCADRAFT_94320 [Volvox carteri f. nagariensis]|uniref:Uncharacterized protein n=1 Tax=Volvox carteri f. nagariensis TaxID=3068 RepID=D8U468_VOLCA|nr:uncharacterized protein VOLCADRAFT_94320 [Volvox carteri f. nagariensis]EFJ45448.1 hypothetical protein VOLCADRAFT_94320 [Volvox carteri f. nagariensis]|eukprot:XP_002953475.1 hypothetical protein VOLCADRAFT_94320 [Volvox carteri f. nagariensis]
MESTGQAALQPGGLASRRDLEGCVALVTGATSGLGLEAAAQLAERGAKVIFGVRNPAKAERVVAAIRKRYPADAAAALDFVLPPAVPPLDVSDPASITRFARALLSDTATPINVLVNNAGTSMLAGPSVDERGINRLVQVNYLGAYHLTRLLEAKLVASGSRVVCVSSVTHRCYEVPTDPRVFLHSTSRMTYAWTKVANVLFAYELQRRLGPLGVQSCAVDPGGVRTSIWDEVPALAHPPAKWVIEALYAPPADGAEVLVAAATLPWERDRVPHVLSPAQDLRYYARGAFTSPLMTLIDGAWRDWSHVVKPALYGSSVVLHSLLDYPIRHFSGGRMFNQTMAVRSARQTYDMYVAAELWSYSEKVTGLTDSWRSPPPPLAEAAAHAVLSGSGANVDSTAATEHDKAKTADRPPAVPPLQGRSNTTSATATAAAGGSPPPAALTSNRKRPVMSPNKTSAADVLQPLDNRPLAIDAAAVGSPKCDAVGGMFPATAAGVENAGGVGGGGSSTTRRRLVATRRDSDAEEGGGGGGGGGTAVSVSAAGDAAMPLVALPPPPETLQHVAEEHGVVLPGQSAVQNAGAGASASVIGGDVLIAVPSFEGDGPTAGTPAPPPHKRLHTQSPVVSLQDETDVAAGDTAVVPVGSVKVGGTDGVGERRGAGADAGGIAGSGEVPAPATVVGLGEDAAVAAAAVAAAVTPTAGVRAGGKQAISNAVSGPRSSEVKGLAAATMVSSNGGAHGNIATPGRTSASGSDGGGSSSAGKGKNKGGKQKGKRH